MFFRRRNKKSNERVLDLKARVDALRAADEATRQKPYSLDHFLEGDDVLTGREAADNYAPAGFDAGRADPAPSPEYDHQFEVDLQAELEKYIRRQEENARPESAGDSTTIPQRHADTAWDAPAVPPPPSSGGPKPPASSWLGEDATWGSPSDMAGAADSGRDVTPPAWPPTRSWPAEEDWPPREDEAV